MSGPDEVERGSPGPAVGVRVAASLVVLGLCATSAAALLADLYDVAEMRTVGRWGTLPGLALLAVIGSSRIPWLGDIPSRIRVGVVGGLLGTLGYDLVRIPFAIAGQRIFAPIDSYGLLLDGGPMSSGWTDLLGWSFHVSNGVTFGIAFVVVMAGRHRGWGIAWGLVLETVAYAGPFTERYALSGQYLSIAIAYAAHVAYGYPLGVVAQRYRDVAAGLRDTSWPRPVASSLAAVVLGLVLWHQPWDVAEPVQEARTAHRQTGLPTAVVVVDRFQPEWLRVERGGCIQLVNRSDRSFSEVFGDLPARGTSRWCFDESGVHRVRLGPRAYSGGFVLVDEGPQPHGVDVEVPLRVHAALRARSE